MEAHPLRESISNNPTGSAWSMTTMPYIIPCRVPGIEWFDRLAAVVAACRLHIEPVCRSFSVIPTSLVEGFYWFFCSKHPSVCGLNLCTYVHRSPIDYGTHRPLWVRQNGRATGDGRTPGVMGFCLRTCTSCSLCSTYTSLFCLSGLLFAPSRVLPSRSRVCKVLSVWESSAM